MNLWVPVLLAGVLSFAIKYAGYVVPARWISGRRTQRVTTLLPVALLAALVTVQTLVHGTTLVLDARIGAVAVAVVALLLRAPFLVVVVLGAATAAGLRALGWG